MFDTTPALPERLLEVLPTPVAVSNRGVVLYANGALRRITGWSRESVSGAPLHQVLDAGGLVGPGGLRVPVLVKSIAGAFQGGAAEYHIALAEDREPTPPPGLDLQMVGHDLRNAIGCLRSNMDFSRAQLSALRHRADEGQLATHPGLGRGVSNVETAIADAEAAIDQVAALVQRLESRAPPRIEHTRPVALFDEAIRVARRHIGLSVRIERVDGCETRVEVEAPRLVQALVNLLLNAAQAAGTTSILLASRAAGAQVYIEVTDDGPGIPPDLRPRVFEPGTTSRRAAGGRGLGLHIVRDAVRAAGGEVTIDCPQSGGTRAVIRLPAARTEKTAAEVAGSLSGR